MSIRATADTPGILALAHFNAMRLAGVEPTADELSALPTLLWSLERNIGLSRFHAIYPMIGSVAATQALDLKGDFPLTWGGTVTHNSDGAQGNKTTGHGDTGYSPDAEMDLSNCHLSYYSEGGTFPAGSAAVFGTGQAAFLGMGWLSGGTREAGALFTASAAQYRPPAPYAVHEGHHCIATNGSRSQQYYIDGVAEGAAINASGAIHADPIYLMAWNNLGTAAILSDKIIKMATIGAQLDATEAAALSAANLAFQTTLGRQI